MDAAYALAEEEGSAFGVAVAQRLQQLLALAP